MTFLHLLFNVQIVSLFCVIHVNLELIIFHLFEEEITIVLNSLESLVVHSIHFLCNGQVALVE